MLVDLTILPNRPEDFPNWDGNIEELKDLLEYLTPRRIAVGMYQLRHWNPEHGVFEEKITGASPITMPRCLTAYERSLPACDIETIQTQLFRESMAEERRIRRRMNRLYSQTYRKNWPGQVYYGVCDYPEQVLERWPHLRDDDTKRAITFVCLRREEQDPTGGWRYHKWGPYIGRQRPKNEYLYNDTHIDEVWTFHVYDVD